MCLKWAVQKFQNFLYGKAFILETDRQPLLYLDKAQYGQNGRLVKWALVLQQYQFTAKAIKGSEYVGGWLFKSSRGHTWCLSFCVTVYLCVFCVVKCFVDLSTYFAGVILQSIWMYV